MCVILQGRCWVEHIPFVHIVKFKFLVNLAVERLVHSVVFSLILFLFKFAAFAYYVIGGYVSITT